MKLVIFRLVFLKLIFLFISLTTNASEMPERLRKVFVAIKVNKYATANTIAAFERVNRAEALIDLNKLIYTEKEIYQNHILNEFPPAVLAPGEVDNRPKPLKNFLKGFDSTSPVNVLPLIEEEGQRDRGLTDTEKKQLMEDVEKALALMDSPDISENKKKRFQYFFSDYLNIDITAGLTETDLDFSEFTYQTRTIENTKKDIEDNQSELVDLIKGNKKSIDESIDRRSKELVAELTEQITKKVRRLEKKSESIETKQADLTKGLHVGSEIGKESWAILKRLEERQLFSDLHKEIYSNHDPSKVAELLKEANTCNRRLARCRYIRKNYQTMKDFKKELEYKLKIKTIGNVTSVLSDLAYLSKSPELRKAADFLGKLNTTIDTLSQMDDLLNRALEGGTLAALGDVTSALSLGTSLLKAFSGAGPTADQMILEELAKIQQQIAELRKEMHERFDQLEQQIVSLGLTVEAQFENVNQGLRVLKAGQDDLKSRMDELKEGNLEILETLRKNALEQKLIELNSYSLGIMHTSNSQEIRQYYLDIVRYYQSYFQDNRAEEVVWSDPLISRKEETDHLAELFTGVLSDGQITRFEWSETLMELARFYSGRTQDLACRKIDHRNFVLFDLLSEPMGRALKHTFEKKEAPWLGSRKFDHFLSGGELEGSYFENLFEPMHTYADSINKLKACFSSEVGLSPRLEEKSGSFIPYLLSRYRNEVSEYLRFIEKIFSKADLIDSLRSAVKDPKGRVFASYEKKFNNFAPDMQAKINFPLIEGYRSYDQLKKDLPAVEIVRRWYSRVPHCNFPKEKIQVHPKVILKVLPKQETWMSILLGLNSIEICFVPDRGFAHINSQKFVEVMSLRYHITGQPKQWGWHPAFAHVQPLFLSKDKVPGKDVWGTRIEVDPNTEKETEYKQLYRQVDFEKVVDQFVSTGDILASMPKCFNHKKFIYQCFPSDFDQKYYFYLPDVTIKHGSPLRNRFITIKGKESEKKFNRFNANESDLRSFFKEVVEIMDSCRAKLARGEGGCQIGTIFALNNAGSNFTQRARELHRWGQIVRMTYENLSKARPSTPAEQVKEYDKDFRLIFMHPSDFLQMALTPQKNTSLKGSIEDLRNDFDKGILYLIDEFDENRVYDFSSFVENKAYLSLESEWIRYQSRINFEVQQ